MKELNQLLCGISDAYDDFVLGVINYAKRDPSHKEILKKYMSSRTDLTSSDVITFIMNQPNFHKNSKSKKI